MVSVNPALNNQPQTILLIKGGVLSVKGFDGEVVKLLTFDLRLQVRSASCNDSNPCGIFFQVVLGTQVSSHRKVDR